jgi:predicted nucleic acid-binding Zn ribbon protein
MKYDFQCPACGFGCEVEETMAEHGKVAHICGECGELMGSIITGGSGFKLEGPGWAKDGYKSHGIIQEQKRGGGPTGNGIVTKE